MNTERLLRILADGRFHSGPAIGAALGVSRSAIWKQLHALEGLGVEVFAVSGRGYRLAAPLDLLEEGAIRAAMDSAGTNLLGGLELLTRIDSTNRHLRQRMLDGVPRGYAVLAEQQTAGRGRRGRPWVSPFAAHVYLSVGWRFAASPSTLAGLPLAVGVAAVQVLRGLGIGAPTLKWPNDVWHDGRKLGGILLELAGEAGGPCDVVAGLGMNVAMPIHAAGQVDQPWTDLQTIMGARRPSRSALAGTLIAQVLQALARYEGEGLEPFLADWRRHDAVAGQRVRVSAGGQEIAGIAEGVDDSGALLLECAGSTVRFASGEVSLRAAP